MALTYSKQMKIGTKAPNFKLPDTISGKHVALDDLTSPYGTVVMFICNHCPYVQHIEKTLTSIAKQYQDKGISFVAISSNDIAGYPEDSPENMKNHALQLGYSFPYLYDESQEVAKSYQAQCTPEFYIFDSTLSCVYHGRFDDSSPGKNVSVTGKDLTAALDALLIGKVIAEQHPSMGCNIKWK